MNKAGKRVGGTVWMAVIVWALAFGLAGAESADEIDGRPISVWVKQLRSENRGLQLRAARALRGAPESAWAAIIPELMPLLKSERENDKFVAAQVLGECGPLARAAVPDLLPMLEGTQHERNRAAAAKALGQILEDAKPGPDIEKVVQALIKVFRDPYPDVQRESVYACGMIGPHAKACLPDLRKPMTYRLGGSSDNPYLQVRRAAAWTAGRMGPDAAEHIDLLISLMHTDGRNAPEMLEAIGRIGPVHDNVAANLVDFLEQGAARDWRHYPESKMAGWKALEAFGLKAAPAVPLIARFLRDGRGTGEPAELIVQWFALLRAAGPAGKAALAEVQMYADASTIPRGWREWAEPISREAAKTVKALSE